MTELHKLVAYTRYALVNQNGGDLRELKLKNKNIIKINVLRF